MNAPRSPYRYHLFDRTLHTDQPLRLLHLCASEDFAPPAGPVDAEPATTEPATTEPATTEPVTTEPAGTGTTARSEPASTGTTAGVTLTWHERPLRFTGPIVAGDAHGAAVAALGAEDGWLVRLAGTGWVARISADGAAVWLHPDAEDRPGARRAADAVVTGVLNRLPMAWGHLPLHGALLDGPTGPVLLSGRSGTGKSTLGQFLVRDHGWRMLDDDAVMARLGGPGGVTLVPMGGRPRVRGDAAALLGVTGDGLSGFADAKIALAGEPAGALAGPVAAVFHLRPRDPGLDGAIEIEQLGPAAALVRGLELVVGLDRTARRWHERRLRFAASLGGRGHVVRYRRGAHHPADVAARLAGHVVDAAG